MADFFYSRIIHVYLIYGLGFFTLGLAVVLEIGRASESRFTQAMPYLAAFGLLHGTHEWIEMFELVGIAAYDFVPPPWWGFGRIAFLSISFAALVAFGVQMRYTFPTRPSAARWGTLAMFTLYAAGAIGLGVQYSGEEWLHAADAWTRYALGVPGSILAAAALHAQWKLLRQAELAPFAKNFLGAAVTFAIYGLGTQAFAPQSELFPSNIVNSNLFRQWTGIPVQALRSILAMLMAYFMIRGFRAFEVDRRLRLQAAERQAREAIARRDALHGELFRRTVAAQEEERTRLARELHDDTLQILTGLSAGLMGVEQTLDTDPARARSQLTQLSAMSSHAIEELRRLIFDLRPSVLDDMGLVTAIRWYASTLSGRSTAAIRVETAKPDCRLDTPVETILFRIAQEGLNNAVRHSQASQVTVRLNCGLEDTKLEIEDDGIGFDPAAVLDTGAAQYGWGLVGIQERVKLADGEFKIDSAPGCGTTLLISVPASCMAASPSGES